VLALIASCSAALPGPRTRPRHIPSETIGRLNAVRVNRPIGCMSTDVPTVGDMRREAGYYTAYKGKWPARR